jgi:hypothetical protein
MTTAVTHSEQSPITEATLFVAFELSEKTWKLGFTTGHGQKPRERTVTACHHELVLNEIAHAKRRMGLSETVPVGSCYEAGRESFWLHRFLQGHGITNHVVDSSAIEVNRRRRRAKSDGLAWFQVLMIVSLVKRPASAGLLSRIGDYLLAARGPGLLRPIRRRTTFPHASAVTRGPPYPLFHRRRPTIDGLMPPSRA